MSERPLGRSEQSGASAPAINAEPLGLFQGFGIEIEYMIVKRGTLNVFPIADQLLESAAGELVTEFERGSFAWSNELALHVVELKTNGPAETLAGLGQAFQREVAAVQEHLAPLGARLLPSGMHPWMDPASEFRLWPHDYSDVYAAFHRIFGCEGHGWSNLQSVHINLPFANDDEFGRLHAAIRMVLPLLPSLAASSPFIEGRSSDYLDTRLHTYAANSARIPEITGLVVPEGAFSRKDYETQILGPIYTALRPHDPEGVLAHEWVNARGAIARFDRMAIEIRLLDVQECPSADIALVRAIVDVVRSLVQERHASYEAQKAFSASCLSALLKDTIRSADEAAVDDRRYLAALGIESTGAISAGAVWARLIDDMLAGQGVSEAEERALEHVVEQGCLARRIQRAVGPGPTRARLHSVYERLAECLERGEGFR